MKKFIIEYKGYHADYSQSQPVPADEPKIVGSIYEPKIFTEENVKQGLSDALGEEDGSLLGSSWKVEFSGKTAQFYCEIFPHLKEMVCDQQN